jgi:hypothetical protein
MSTGKLAIGNMPGERHNLLTCSSRFEVVFFHCRYCEERKEGDENIDVRLMSSRRKNSSKMKGTPDAAYG